MLIIEPLIVLHSFPFIGQQKQILILIAEKVNSICVALTVACSAKEYVTSLIWQTVPYQTSKCDS